MYSVLREAFRPFFNVKRATSFKTTQSYISHVRIKEVKSRLSALKESA